MDIPRRVIKNISQRMTNSSTLRPIALAILACLSAGCASVSVKNSDIITKKNPRKKPQEILVKPFSFYEPGLQVDRSGKALEEFKAKTQAQVQETLVSRLTKHIAPARAVPENARLPRGNYWLITGRIDRIHQGSRALRAVVGFGMGGTKFETTSVVHDLSVRPPRPFLVIETTGGSNAAPGAIGAAGYAVSGIMALPALGNLFEGVRSGVTFDTVRTSKEMTAALSEYLYKQRAISRESALSPKQPGKWQPDFWPFRNAPAPLPEGSITVSPAR